MIYQKDDLKNQLKDMGITPQDSLVVHASMKAMGNVAGGADTVLDALMEYLQDGLLLLPTHTWGTMGETHKIFDPVKDPCCVGILPELFRKRAGVVRSLHPTHSMAAYGKDSIAYVQGEDESHTPCPAHGCWARLEALHAKILLIGIGHEKNTFIHAVEEALDVPERLSPEAMDYAIRMPDGSIKPCAMHKHYNPHTDHISEAYPKLTQAFYDCKAAKPVQFGDAACILCDAARIAEVIREVLSHERNCLIARESIPQEWWANCIPEN